MAQSRFGRAMNATFVGAGYTLGAAIDFFIAPGIGNSAREAGRIVGGVAGLAGDVGVIGAAGAREAARGIADRRRQNLVDSIAAAAESEDFPRLLALAREFSQGSPTDPNGFAWEAMALVEIGEYAEALQAAERAAQLGLAESELRVLRAEIHAGCEDYAGAARELAFLVDDPEYRSYALMGRANAFLIAGDLASALREADHAVAASPDAAAYFVRGNVYREMGRLDECLEQYNRALAIDSNSTMLLDSRAEVYEMAGRDAEAAADRAAVQDATDVDASGARMAEARETLAYLRDRGVQITIADNGRDLAIRGPELRSETRATLARLKPQLLALLNSSGRH